MIGPRASSSLTARGRPWSYENLEQRWYMLVRKVPVPDGISLYTMRHTWASSAINDTNVNPALVAQQMGHTDLTMLLKHYLEKDPAALQRAVEEVSRKKPE